MSTFTSRSASQEIPRQFFSSLKTHVFARLRELSGSADWNELPNAVNGWDDSAKMDELNMFLGKNPSAHNQFRYTVLRTVKTLQQSENKTSLRMRAQDLDRIDLSDFYASFFRDMVENADVRDLESFRRLTPSDREIVAEDVYRTNLYRVVHIVSDNLVGGGSVAASRRSVKKGSSISRRSAASRPTVTSRVTASVKPPATVPEIRPDDSVSCAPSEVVSQIGEGLNAQILSLHEEKNNQQQQQQQQEAPPQVVEKESSPPEEEKPGTVLDLQVPSRSTRRSKFSRSPTKSKRPPASSAVSRKKKPLAFFDTEVSRRTVLSRSDI